MSRTIRIAAVFFGLLKVGLALLVPVMGDEAYYVAWGSRFSGGYYDLPPMAGWWLWPLLRVSAHPLWLRSLNLLAAGLIAFGIHDWLSTEVGKDRARRTAWLHLLLPLPFLSVISYPDLPLTFFSFFSALLFHRSVLRQERFWSPGILVSGALWGAAFLSKYFAVFLLPAFLIWAWPRARRPWGGVLSFLAGAAPFLLQHVWWNSRHCWANFVFNLISRQQEGDGPRLQTAGGFLLNLGLVFLPLLLAGLRSRRNPVRAPSAGGNAPALAAFFRVLCLVPIVIFAATSLLGKGQGLHWLLFLTPFAAAWAGLVLPDVRMTRALRISSIFTGALGMALLVFFAFPARFLPEALRERHALDLSMLAYPEEFHATLEPRVREARMLFTESYSRSSVIEHQFLRYSRDDERPELGVVMSGSRFGRVYDWRVDWPALEGATVAFFRVGGADSGFLSPYFETEEDLPLESEGASFGVRVGRGFRARKFWEERVRGDLERFYPRFFGSTCGLTQWPDGESHAR